MNATSVIVCTHNPRPQYLRAVFGGLRNQTLPLTEWELLLVDNASTEPVAKWADISWHPHARHVCEETLGIAWARIRGIAEAKGDLLVFVDDDNVLEKDYLAHAKAIAAQHPQLGAWSGNVQLEFEKSPPEWTKPYWHLLAARQVATDAQGRSTLSTPAILPIGAGMCFRRELGLFYREQWLQSSIRKFFGARGQSCALGEDTDLALTAAALGMNTGVFARLKLTHLIPAQRVTEEYLLRLSRGVAMATFLMQLVRGEPIRRRPQGLKWWTKFIYDCARKWGRTRRFYAARELGKRDALRNFAAFNGSAPKPARLPERHLVPRQHHPAA
jgi:hypothetical protein